MTKRTPLITRADIKAAARSSHSVARGIRRLRSQKRAMDQMIMSIRLTPTVTKTQGE